MLYPSVIKPLNVKAEAKREATHSGEPCKMPEEQGLRNARQDCIQVGERSMKNPKIAVTGRGKRGPILSGT